MVEGQLNAPGPKSWRAPWFWHVSQCFCHGSMLFIPRGCRLGFWHGMILVTYCTFSMLQFTLLRMQGELQLPSLLVPVFHPSHHNLRLIKTVLTYANALVWVLPAGLDWAFLETTTGFPCSVLLPACCMFRCVVDSVHRAVPTGDAHLGKHIYLHFNFGHFTV